MNPSNFESKRQLSLLVYERFTFDRSMNNEVYHERTTNIGENRNIRTVESIQSYKILYKIYCKILKSMVSQKKEIYYSV